MGSSRFTVPRVRNYNPTITAIDVPEAGTLLEWLADNWNNAALNSDNDDSAAVNATQSSFAPGYAWFIDAEFQTHPGDETALELARADYGDDPSINLVAIKDASGNVAYGYLGPYWAPDWEPAGVKHGVVPLIDYVTAGYTEGNDTTEHAYSDRAAQRNGDFGAYNDVYPPNDPVVDDWTVYNGLIASGAAYKAMDQIIGGTIRFRWKETADEPGTLPYTDLYLEQTGASGIPLVKGMRINTGFSVNCDDLVETGKLRVFAYNPFLGPSAKVYEEFDGTGWGGVNPFPVDVQDASADGIAIGLERTGLDSPPQVGPVERRAVIRFITFHHVARGGFDVYPTIDNGAGGSAEEAWTDATRSFSHVDDGYNPGDTPCEFRFFAVTDIPLGLLP